MMFLLKSNFLILVLFFFLFLLILFLLFSFNDSSQTNSKIAYGVTFSPPLAKDLSEDWRIVFADMMDELQVKNLRIPTFWEELEKEEGKINFEDIDYIVDEATKKNLTILLVLGIKQPRWPECHIPQWAFKYTAKQRQKMILSLIKKTVDRYKDNPTIWGWQVENEPLFWFGDGCDPVDTKFLTQEVELVRSLDQSRPIILTDSGEWQSWITPMMLSDILGISVYKKAYNPLFGYTEFPMPAFVYQFKSRFIRKVFAKNNKQTIISELQAEPWLRSSFQDVPIIKQTKLFSTEDFKSNINFAQNLGFPKVYLWGVEWWYYARSQGYPEYWEYAKSVFKD